MRKTATVTSNVAVVVDYEVNPKTGDLVEIGELAPMTIDPLAIADPELYRQVWNAQHPDMYQEHPPSFTPEQLKANEELCNRAETPKHYNLHGINLKYPCY